MIWPFGTYANWRTMTKTHTFEICLRLQQW